MTKFSPPPTGDATGGIFLDPETLGRLKSSNNQSAMAASWLSAMARLDAGIQQGLVVMSGVGQARFEPVGVWPEGATPAKELLTATESAVRGQRLVIETGKDGGAAIAAPIVVDGQLRGAAAILGAASEDTGFRLLIDHLQWGIGWLEALVRRRRSSGGEGLPTVVELLATGLHHKRFKDAATAVASELAGALNCELVAIGHLRGRHCRVSALSNSASFGKRANLVRSIEAAMDEAVDQQSVLVYPAPDGATERVLRSHAALSDMEGQAELCTVPLTEGKRITGALFLERPKGEAFKGDVVQLAEHSAVLLGPVLDIKRREDRWLTTKAWDASVNLFKALFGPRHAALKLGVILLAAFIAFCWYATGTYRVTADAAVEGRVQRAVIAPLAGYLATAEARAGDIVQDGQVLARLDDRDLRLERLKWVSQKSKQTREYSEAVARRERAQARILQAQIEQADAQLELLDQQLARMVVTAPFAGVVVSGDLTQALGAPVERGDVLFEVAPLDEYRVKLRVDERDVEAVSAGQGGNVVLSALPDSPLGIRIERITPVSVAEAGTNLFVVEASLADGQITDLRPGMEGVAKIEIEERRLIWIWTRRIVLWARMTLWSWWP